MDEALRLEIALPLPGEELFVEELDREDDEEYGLDGMAGVVLDLIYGAIACLAACSTRRLLKILVPKCDPS